VHFYTGVPSATDNAFWHGFWSNKLAMMGRRGVTVYSRSLVYRNKTIQVPGFGAHTFLGGEKKGIDVRLALDALDAAHRNQFDVAVIFSQDQDLSELGSLIAKSPGFRIAGSRLPALSQTAPPPPIDAVSTAPTGARLTNQLMMPVSTRAITGPGHKWAPFL
jgi:hypothetical protein